MYFNKSACVDGGALFASVLNLQRHNYKAVSRKPPKLANITLIIVKVGLNQDQSWIKKIPDEPF